MKQHDPYREHIPVPIESELLEEIGEGNWRVALRWMAVTTISFALTALAGGVIAGICMRILP